MLAIDWGTSSLRAYRVARGGAIEERREAPLGILAVKDGAFEEALSSLVGDWIADGVRPIVMSGMIGSRQGWREVPYVATPAGPLELADGLLEVACGSSASAFIVPGLTTVGEEGVHDVMRGEETQIIGALARLGDGRHVICLPGTHRQWAVVEHGKITGFRTHMTGEMYAVLRTHSILGRTITPGPGFDRTAFECGVRRSADGGGLLHQLFGVRAEALAGVLEPRSSADYLSGLLVGSELRAEAPSGTVRLLGAADLVARYAVACEILSLSSQTLDTDSVVPGLYRVASARGLVT
ncbi:MAG: 2-keto-3-deoxy-galactonokinase [Betaproteobacteria bacterium]|nr:2-keto-3-deoxy-galactonokinase [Betaproteobacteria bacterium]